MRVVLGPVFAALTGPDVVAGGHSFGGRDALQGAALEEALDMAARFVSSLERAT